MLVFRSYCRVYRTEGTSVFEVQSMYVNRSSIGLVTAGLKAFGTIKNTSVVHDIVRVLIVHILGLIFFALLVLICTVDPHLGVSFPYNSLRNLTDPLQEERRQLINY